jgi:hypothetical protein
MPNNLPSNLNSFPANNLSRPVGLGASGSGGIGLAGNNSLSKNPPSRLGRDRSKSALEQIDISKISKGRLMTEGTYEKSFGMNKGVGLKGQLNEARMAGRRHSTKNLSRENMEQMHDLLAEAIKKSSVSSGSYISRQNRVDIMRKSRQLAKSPNSKFTFEDRKDLMKIVDSMRQQYKESLFKKDDAPN